MTVHIKGAYIYIVQLIPFVFYPILEFFRIVDTLKRIFNSRQLCQLYILLLFVSFLF